MIEKMQISQKVIVCSMLATRHHSQKRLRFSGSCFTIAPAAGAASGSPVMGETIFGM